ncbi:MAG: hypothetical protein M3022_07120, partial [Actinomycetota bacterium]|nr:hypothetical protein [Actinomycetota bacterium]
MAGAGAAGAPMIFRPRSSPLHSARAGVACAYCLALLLAALLNSNPIVLGAVALATAGAGISAGVGREVRRAARFALPFGLVIAAVNALVTRDGLTVII